MAEISNELIYKLMLEIQAEQKAMRADIAAVRQEQTRTNEKLDAQSTTLVGIRRDLHRMQSEVATLLSAVDDHSRRLGMIEKPSDDDQPHA
jgi:chromosome segregation ATPase